MIRLYFNEEGSEPWTLDRGPGSPKVNFSTPQLNGFFGDGRIRAVTDFEEKDRVNEPVAWLEFRHEGEL